MAANRQQEADRVDPGEAQKPDDPTDLKKRSWLYIARKTAREFGRDQCTDLAAALVYFSVQALFPGLLALVSLLGLFGQSQHVVDTVAGFLQGFDPSLVAAAKKPIAGLAKSPAAPATFIIGVLGALWSASGYVGAFGRAMNRVYEVEEGRTTLRRRPAQLGVTAVVLILVVIAALILVVSGPIAGSIGGVLGLSSVTVLVWSIVKWPVLVAIVVVMVGLLYYFSPNVKQPKFRWMSVGALLAIVIWALASLAFGFYVANFSKYNATYGSLGAVIIFLLWLWITNIALLFGAEFDAELERGRELQAGIAAEEDIQLPLRSTKLSDKKRAKRDEDIESGRRLRSSRGEDS
jgi:membrane protein